MMSLFLIEDVERISRIILNTNDVKTFNPEAIVYIEKAGRLIGKTMSRIGNLPIYSVQTVRSGDSFKNKIRHIFNFLPWQLSHLLRKIELSLPIHKTFLQRDIEVCKDLPVNIDTRILLVDDAVDSGISLKSVVNFLNDKGYKNIFTAVITTTSKRPVFRADYTHLNRLITFPWSIGSRDYYKYQELYNSLNE